jgi:hypothetical protein
MELYGSIPAGERWQVEDYSDALVVYKAEYEAMKRAVYIKALNDAAI